MTLEPGCRRGSHRYNMGVTASAEVYALPHRVGMDSDHEEMPSSGVYIISRMQKETFHGTKGKPNQVE